MPRPPKNETNTPPSETKAALDETTHGESSAQDLLDGENPEDRLSIGTPILVWFRGAPEPFPGWVTRIRAAGQRQAAPWSVTVLMDRGTGIAVLSAPTHRSRANGAMRETTWDFYPED